MYVHFYLFFFWPVESHFYGYLWLYAPKFWDVAETYEIAHSHCMNSSRVVIILKGSVDTKTLSVVTKLIWTFCTQSYWGCKNNRSIPALSLVVPSRWRTKGVHPARAPPPPPRDQHFLNFMQFFLGKFGKKLCVGNPRWRVGAPSYGNPVSAMLRAHSCHSKLPGETSNIWWLLFEHMCCYVIQIKPQVADIKVMLLI